MALTPEQVTLITVAALGKAPGADHLNYFITSEAADEFLVNGGTTNINTDRPYDTALEAVAAVLEHERKFIEITNGLTPQTDAQFVASVVANLGAASGATLAADLASGMPRYKALVKFALAEEKAPGTIAKVANAAGSRLDDAVQELIDSQSVPGETFTLTAGAETFAPLAEGEEAVEGVTYATADNDLIKGVTSSLTAERTLDSQDKIDGGEGVDTLQADMKGNFGGFLSDGYLKNVEKVELSNEGTINRTFTATGVEGVQEYILKGAVNLSGLTSTDATVTVEGRQTHLDVGYTTKAVEGTADKLVLNVNNVGKVDDAATATNEEVSVNLTAASIEELALKTQGDNVLNLSNSQQLKTITAEGTGSLNIKAVANQVTAFDASANEGKVTADLSTSGTLTSIKGGAGDDVITADASRLNSQVMVDGGAGNNTLSLKGTGTSMLPTITNIQTLNLAGVTGTMTINASKTQGLETISLTGTGNTATLTTAGLTAGDLKVQTTGTQNGTLVLNDSHAVNYTTTASAATQKAQNTVETVATSLEAAKAGSAVINVGAYTKQTGNLKFNSATDVTLNVASGKNSVGAEQTDFDANLEAKKAQSLTIKADGNFNAGTKTIDAAEAQSVVMELANGGGVKLEAAKATVLELTAGDNFTFADLSNLTGVQQATLTANKGTIKLEGAIAGTNDANLSAINTLNLAGGFEGTTKQSRIELHDLGTENQDYGITLNATGLKGGLTVNDILTKGHDVNVNLSGMTGAATINKIGDTAKFVGNVTLTAAKAGSTTVTSAIMAAANKAVTIDASNVLGTGTGNALTLNDVTVAKDAVSETGSINLDVNGLNTGFSVGALQAKTITIDATNYMASDIGTAQITKLTGDNLTIKGSAIKATQVVVDTVPSTTTPLVINFTGGMGADKVTVNKGIITEVVQITMTGDLGSDTLSFVGDADFTAAGSKLTLNSVDIIEMAASKNLKVNAADISGQSLQIKLDSSTPGTATLNGTTGNDTIDLTNVTTTAAVTTDKYIVDAKAGTDTIKLPSSTDHNFTVKFAANLASNGVNHIQNFNAAAGNDVLDFSAFIGASTAGSHVWTPVATGTAAATLATDAVTLFAGEQLQASDFGAGADFAAFGSGKAVVIATGADKTTGNIYFVEGGTDETITLVGTLTGIDGAWNDANVVVV